MTQLKKSEHLKALTIYFHTPFRSSEILHDAFGVWGLGAPVVALSLPQGLSTWDVRTNVYTTYPEKVGPLLDGISLDERHIVTAIL